MNFPFTFFLRDGIRVDVVQVSKDSFSFLYSFPSGEKTEKLYRRKENAKRFKSTSELPKPYEFEAANTFWYDFA